MILVYAITLKPTNDRSADLVRLKPGQSCTVGRSHSADYALKSSGLDAIHCRITCRRRSAFVECLSAESFVHVNGQPVNRARLTHGESLQIGDVEFVVEVPQEPESQPSIPEPAKTEFPSTGTESFDSDTTASIEFDSWTAFDSDDNIELDPESLEWPDTKSEPPPTPQEDAGERRQDSRFQQEGVSQPGADDDLELDDHLLDQSDHFDDSGEEPLSTTSVDDDPFMSDEAATTESAADTSDGGFDSDDLDWFHREEQPVSPPAEPETQPTREPQADHRDDDRERAESEFAETLARKLGQSSVPKFERLYGAAAEDAAKDLLADDYLQAFRLARFNLLPVEQDYSSFCEAVEPRDGAVVLFSDRSPDALDLFLSKGRMSDRLRYPLAVQRFLEFSPPKLIKAFFDSFPHCLLILENNQGVQLLRATTPDTDSESEPQVG